MPADSGESGADDSDEVIRFNEQSQTTSEPDDQAVRPDQSPDTVDSKGTTAASTTHADAASQAAQTSIGISERLLAAAGLQGIAVILYTAVFAGLLPATPALAVGVLFFSISAILAVRGERTSPVKSTA